MDKMTAAQKLMEHFICLDEANVDEELADTFVVAYENLINSIPRVLNAAELMEIATKNKNQAMWLEHRIVRGNTCRDVFQQILPSSLAEIPLSEYEVSWRCWNVLPDESDVMRYQWRKK